MQQLLERKAGSRLAIQEAFDRMAWRHRLDSNVGWGLADQVSHWVFHSFGNYSGVRGRGAKCLQEVCALADDFGITIHLWTASAALNAYYEGFGFDRTEAPRPRGDGVQWLKRQSIMR